MKKRLKHLAALTAISMIAGSIDPSVSFAAVQKAKLNQTNTMIYVGGPSASKTTTLKVSVAGKAKKAVFTSDNSQIASVNRSTGVVTAKKKGTTSITARYNNKSYKCKIVVTKFVYVTSIKVTPSSKTLSVGKSLTLTKTVQPASASWRIVSYASSDPKVATVTKAGKVKAVKPGKAVITVTALGSKKNKVKKTVAITVKKVSTATSTPKKSSKPAATSKPKTTPKPSSTPVATATPEPTATPVVPEVQSITTDNLKSVVVKFTTDVDKASLDKMLITNTLSGQKINAEASLLDSKTAVLVATNTFSQNQKITVKVSGVKTLDGVVLPEKEEQKTVIDTAIPQLVSAKAPNARQIVLQFNEPINYNASTSTVMNNITVDGVQIIASASSVYAENKVIFNLTSNMAVGNRKIVVSDLVDFAGFKLPSSTQTFDVALDNKAPELVTAVVRDFKTVRVTFNEALGANGNFRINGAVVSKVTVIDDKTLDLSCNLDVGAIVEIKLGYQGQKDIVGNEVVSEKVYSFHTEDDTTVPSVKASVGDNNKIVLDFSKKMQPIGTIKLLDKENNAMGATPIVVDNSLFKSGSDNKVIELSSSLTGLNQVDASDYVLHIEGMKDSSIRQTILPEQNLAIHAKDTKIPVVQSTYLYQSGIDTVNHSDDTLTFYFSEEMNKDSLSNLSNYFVAGSNMSVKSGVYVKSIAADGKSIVINYPASAELGSVNVSGVKDLAGNPAATTSVTRNRNTAIAFVSAKAISRKEVVVTLNSKIASAAPSAIKICKKRSGVVEDYAVPSNAVIDSEDACKVKFSFDRELDSTDTSAFSIADNNSNLLLNIYGDSFKTNGNSSDVIGNKPLTDQVAPELLGITQGTGSAGLKQIILHYSEKVSIATGFNYDLKLVNTATRNEILPAYFTTEVTGTDSADIVITLQSGTENVNKNITVALTSGRYLTDAAATPNRAKEFTAQIVKDATGNNATFNIAALR